MRKFAMFFLLCLIVLVVCGCEARFDTSSEKALDKSAEKVMNSMPAERQVVLREALTYLWTNGMNTYMQKATSTMGKGMNNPMGWVAEQAANQAKAQEEIYKVLEGKTGEEVIVVVEGLRAELQATQEKERQAALVESNRRKQERQAAKESSAKESSAKESSAKESSAKESSAKEGSVVKEVLEAGGYTYVRVERRGLEFWAATPEFTVKVGDQVLVPEGMPMPDYHSKTLDRTFDMVYFVPSISVVKSVSPNVRQEKTQQTSSVDKTKNSCEEAKNGETEYSVDCLVLNKESLDGKEVRIKGKVVKFSPEIMGENWITLEDEANKDIRVTTKSSAEVGEVVILEGTLVLNKDFGYGYKFDLIILDAKKI